MHYHTWNAIGSSFVTYKSTDNKWNKKRNKRERTATKKKTTVLLIETHVCVRVSKMDFKALDTDTTYEIMTFMGVFFFSSVIVVFVAVTVFFRLLLNNLFKLDPCLFVCLLASEAAIWRINCSSLANRLYGYSRRWCEWRPSLNAQIMFFFFVCVMNLFTLDKTHKIHRHFKRKSFVPQIVLMVNRDKHAISGHIMHWKYSVTKILNLKSHNNCEFAFLFP